MGSKFPGYNPFGIALIAYYLLMALVGLLIPDDILSANAWAREFSDFMASVVPQIDRITALNIKPSVNRFYFSVLWAGSPVLLLIVCIMMWDAKRRDVATMWTAPLRIAALPMLFGLVVCVLLLLPQLLVDPSMRLSRNTFGSSFGRGFLAQIFVLGPILFGPGICAWVVCWLTGTIPRNIRKMENLK